MPAKQTARKKAPTLRKKAKTRRANNTPRSKCGHVITAATAQPSRELTKCAMKKAKTTHDGVKWNSADGTEKTDGKNATTIKWKRALRFRYSKTALKEAIQRYVDLFECAPTGYVAFNRSGRIEEINSTATHLLGRSRRRLIGNSFAICVAKEHTQHFLQHLSKCHSSDGPVVTELYLRRPDGEKFPVQLSSTATVTLTKDGARLYQTALVDLTERKTAEQARFEAVRRQRALYELSQRHQEAKTLYEIYEAALDAILTALPCDRASILLSDQRQVMRFVAWRGLSEKYRKAVEGHSPWKPDVTNPQPVCISDVDLADIPKSLKSTIRSEGIRAVTFVPLVSSGTLIGKFMAYHNAPHLSTDDELKLATTIARQLAQAIQHKRDEESLRESEARMRATVEQANAGIARYNGNGDIEFANKRFCKMLGYQESELIGKNIREFTHSDDVEKTMRAFERVLKKGKLTELEKRYIRRDGSVVWVNVSDAPERDALGRPKSVVAVAVDIAARKKAEATLKKSKELLEKLVQQRTKALRVANAELKNEIEHRKGLEGEILAISDREQQRLGQELHDGLCQHLTAVAFMARSVALRLKNHRVIDVKDIEKIAQLVNDAATDTRNLSRALHRLDVDAAGLVTALQDLVDREIWRIACRLEVKPSFHIHDDAAAAQLYRIAREAVINANKHAQAREIVVKLERSRRGMVLRVTDDGIGIPNQPEFKHGLGLHIMNYRAQLAGGRLQIESPKEGGTCVSCYFLGNPRRSPKSHKQENPARQRSYAAIAKALATLT
jgi:PAS domain S-box-containing protein